MSSLLEQAIIDAKQLKEAALKNAENLVIEKYSNEVKQTVQSLLEQEEPQKEQKSLNSVTKQVPDAFFKPIEEDLPVIIDLDELDAQLKKAVMKESLDIDQIDEDDCLEEGGCGEPSADSEDRFGRPTGAREPSGDREVIFGLEEEDEAIYELDDDILEMYLDEGEGDGVCEQCGEEKHEGHCLEEEEDLEEEVDLKKADRNDNEKVEDWEMAIAKKAFGGKSKKESDKSKDKSKAAPEEEPIAEDFDALEDLEEQVLNNLYEKLKVNVDDIGRSGFGNLGVPDVEVAEMQEIIAALEDSLADGEDEKEEIKKENKDLRRAGLALKENNDKLRDAVHILKEKLEQVNVSNAKLLYINQAIGNASLNERQKDKIVEAISRADSVREAKVIFETLQGTVGQGSYKESLPQSLSEVVSRTSSMLMAGNRPENNKRNPLKDRMQILAGIK